MPQMKPLIWLPMFLTIPLIIMMIMTLSYSTYYTKIQSPNSNTYKTPHQWKW